MSDKLERNTPVLEKIKSGHDKFTPAQKAIAGYILQNPESLYFMPIVKMAQETRVSVASIVRFCNALGYKGYTELIKDVQQELQSQLSTSSRFQIARSCHSETISSKFDKGGDSAFTRILSHEIEHLGHLLESIKIDQFNKAVQLLENADRVLILGCLASSTLASHMGRMLSKIKPAVDVVDNDGILESTKWLQLTQKSVVCIFAFPRYPTLTIRLANCAVKKGCRIISITDTNFSPISEIGELTFYIQVGVPSFVDAYAAPLTFINALCAELAENSPTKSKKALMEFDELALKNKLFIKQIWRGKPRKKTTNKS